MSDKVNGPQWACQALRYAHLLYWQAERERQTTDPSHYTPDPRNNGSDQARADKAEALKRVGHRHLYKGGSCIICDRVGT